MTELSFLRNAIDQSAIVAVTDLAGRIIHVNDLFCNISQYNRQELIGQNHRIINSGHHPKEFFTQMWKTISSGNIWKGEIKNRAKDGSYYWVYTSIIPYKNAEGKVEQYVSLRYEITPTKDAQESLRSLFDSTFEGLVIHTEEGTILDINETGCQLLGRTKSEILREPLSTFITDLPYAKNLGAKTFKQQSVTLPDGRRRDFEVASKTIVYLSKPCWITAFSDVTERSEMQAQILQQDRLASIGLLASSLAHEIGTPLGVIRGRAELLEIQADQNQNVKNGAQIIMTQIDRVSRLIRSLLTLARGDGSTDLIPVTIQRVVSEVTELLLPEMNKKQITLQVNVPSDLRVRAQNGPFHQVLLNLLVNSIHAIESAQKKFTRNERHQITIAVNENPKSNENHPGYIELYIQDTGSGISEAHLKQLFKPFFTTKDIGVGTGLGLATSYKIINSWGGQIRAQSQVDQGTTFFLKLKNAAQ